MNALRNVNRQLELKTEGIKQKCTELASLQDYYIELESKCKEQSKRIQHLEIEQLRTITNNKDRYFIKKQ